MSAMITPVPRHPATREPASDMAKRFVIAQNFDDIDPFEAVREAGITLWGRGRGVRLFRQFYSEQIFGDPELWQMIHQRHMLGERFDLTTAGWLDQFEEERGLPWSIAEWHREENYGRARRTA
jgi:hypothetical protein